MKVAIATEGGQVAQHFGHCKTYTFYTLENQEIQEKTTIENPGHRPGFLPGYLKERGVETIISGGMGAAAQLLFKNAGVDVIVGAKGEIDDVIASYLAGTLQSTDEVCNHDSHHHD